MVDEKGMNLLVPSSWGLVESINRFDLPAGKASLCLLPYTLRYFHSDFFLQFSVQKSGFDVHAMEFPIIFSNQYEKQSECSKLCGGCKGFLKSQSLASASNLSLLGEP